MFKKSLSVIVIIILIIIGGGIYFFFFGQGSKTKVGETLQNFFPFGVSPQGSDISPEDLPGGLNGGDSESLENLPVPVLRKVFETPVAGVTLIETASSTTIRLIDRGTGHMYDTSTNSLVIKRISNTTIPKIYDVLWGEEGNSFIIRFLKDDRETIETFYAQLPKQEMAQESTLEGEFLSTNILEISPSPDKKKIFSITESTEGGIGTISNFDGTNKKVFSLPIKEVLASWDQKNYVTLTTKPSSQTEGYVYFLNIATGSFTKVLGGVAGLTDLVNDSGQKILYAETKNKKINLFLLDRETGQTASIPLSTLPEKCVWGTQNKDYLYCAVPKSTQASDYPDSWYQGVTSFNDSLWKIDTKTGETKIIYEFDKNSLEVDMINPLLNEEETYIVFMNKKDLTLWSLRLTN